MLARHHEPRPPAESAPAAGARSLLRRLTPWIAPAAVAAFLALHWLLGTTALRDKSTTCDEIVHLVAGCAYWLQNDYRLQPENGNLPQRWHALPMILTGAKLPAAGDPDWKTSEVWRLGRSFFYDVGNDADTMLARGRASPASRSTI